MLKCKFMIIDDISARQDIMHNDSEREKVLFSEEFECDKNQNFEFVVGLPLQLRHNKNFNFELLADDYRYHAIQILNTKSISIAIHEKNKDEEIHFHINFINDKTAEENEGLLETIRNIYTALNNELVSKLAE